MSDKPGTIKVLSSLARQEVRDILQRPRYRAAWDEVDYFFVSHPKTGRTWVRVFLAHYFSLYFNVPFDTGFKLLETPEHPEQPKIHFTHSSTLLNSYEVKTYSRLFSKSKLVRRGVRSLQGKRVLFLVRDPRDTVVSWYYHLRYRDEKFTKTLSEFVHDPQYGIASIVDYMNQYMQNKETFAQFFLFRYEDLRVDPNARFREMLEALNVPVSDEILEQAIEESSFSKMKQAAAAGNLSKNIRPRNAHDPRTAKVRKGKVGGFVEEFSGEDLAFANKCIEQLDERFGYEV